MFYNCNVTSQSYCNLHSRYSLLLGLRVSLCVWVQQVRPDVTAIITYCETEYNTYILTVFVFLELSK